MLNVDVFNADNVKTGNAELSPSAFLKDFNEDLVLQAVVSYQAAGRSGSRAQKNRSDVRGGGRKPWKQKGSGRARAGSSRSPIWKGGGVTFAARPQDYTKKINKKMYRAAISSIYSELLRTGRLIVVDSFEVDEISTKKLKSKLGVFGEGRFLIISDSLSDNLILSSRNLINVEVRSHLQVDPVVLVSCDKVVITVEAARQISEVL